MTSCKFEDVARPKTVSTPDLIIGSNYKNDGRVDLENSSPSFEM